MTGRHTSSGRLEVSCGRLCLHTVQLYMETWQVSRSFPKETVLVSFSKLVTEDNEGQPSPSPVLELV